MYTKSKYVILEHLETVIAFPEWITHTEVFPAAKKIAAGFFYVKEDNTVVARGESVSLSLKSRGEIDAKLIARQLNIGPMRDM